MITEQETEYSKVWAMVHPELFSASFLSFLDEHPSKDWILTIETTKGFFTVNATRRSK